MIFIAYFLKKNFNFDYYIIYYLFGRVSLTGALSDLRGRSGEYV